MANNQASAIEKLDRFIRARYPIIGIVSHEETRVMGSIQAIASRRGRRVVTWAVTTGLMAVRPSEAAESWSPDADLAQIDSDGTRDIVAALQAILDFDQDCSAEPVLFVIKDLHGIIGSRDRGFDPIITRYLRDIAGKLEVCKHNLILLSPSFAVPGDLDKTMVLIDWPLPDTEELEAILSKCERDLPSRIPVTLNGNRDKVIQAMRGLTAFEAGSVLLTAIAATGELSDNCVPYIVAEKSQIIRKDGTLEYFDETVTMDQVGGLEQLKVYASKKRSAFSASARQAGVDTPKGVLLVGVPGTGKSLSAKAIAGGQMPLLRMDIGSIMASHIGESEDNMRRALKLADAIAPCVLWIDEIEKALGGVESSNSTDGGVTMRVFGTLLTWMQENKNPVYLVATANSTRGLKPELLSRFDDVIFVDLPNREARVEILRVHLTKRGYDAADYDLDKVAGGLWGYSGREIEKVVKAAIETAFFEGKKLTTDHLLKAGTEIVPVSVTSKTEIDAVRAWAGESNARMAAQPLEPQPRTQGNQSRVVNAEL